MNAATLHLLYARRRRLQNEAADVYYHGTKKAFDKFAEPKFKTQQLGFGIHFTQDPELANHYTGAQRVDKPGPAPGGNIRPSRLTMNKTLDTTKLHHVGTPEHEFAKELHKGTGRPLITQKDEHGNPRFVINMDVTSPKRAQALLQKHGYDSVHYDAVIAQRTGYGVAKVRSAKSTVVLDPGQVKSVFEDFKTNLPDETGHYTLYHGTSSGSAEMLRKDGWSPHSSEQGSHCGRPQYLYLTNDPVNAAWYAGEKDRKGKVLQVRVHRDHLKVDPDDGVHDTVHDELNSGIPGSVVAHVPLRAHQFTRQFSIRGAHRVGEQVLYHGTPPENVDKIQAVGLVPAVGKNTRDAEGHDVEANVNLTSDRKLAKKYAGKGGTVFSVELSKPELQGLVPKKDDFEKASVKVNGRVPPEVLRAEALERVSARIRKAL